MRIQELIILEQTVGTTPPGQQIPPSGQTLGPSTQIQPNNSAINTATNITTATNAISTQIPGQQQTIGQPAVTVPPGTVNVPQQDLQAVLGLLAKMNQNKS